MAATAAAVRSTTRAGSRAGQGVERHCDAGKVEGPGGWTAAAGGPLPSRNRVPAPWRSGRYRRYPGIVGVVDQQIVRLLVGEDLGLGGDVGRVAGMPVEMVRCDVEENRGRRMESLRQVELKARDLHRQCLIGVVGDADKGVPMLPTAAAEIPEAESMAATASVVVVLPLVPVIATRLDRGNGSDRCRQANSTSLQTGMPASSASVMGAARSGTPGLATTRPMPARRSGSQRPVTTPMPSPIRAVPASERWS